MIHFQVPIQLSIACNRKLYGCMTQDTLKGGCKMIEYTKLY